MKKQIEQFREIGGGILGITLTLLVAYLSGGKIEYVIVVGFSLGLAFFVTAGYLERKSVKKTSPDEVMV